MTWKEISDSKIFRKDVMDAIISELPPTPDALKITNAFMPVKNVDDDRIIALRKNGAFGKTAPVNLAAEHAHIPMLGGMYIESTTGYWRESILFGEDDLMKIRNPEDPKRIWGQEMVTQGLGLLDTRLNNRMEQLSADVVFKRGFSVAQNGVNYTYTPLIAPKYYIDMGATAATGFTNAPWRATPADTDRWSDTTNSNPLRDLREVRRIAGQWGLNLVEVWMNSIAAGYIEDNAQSQKLIQASYSLAEKSMAADQIVKITSGLKGLIVIVDDRHYNEETYFTAASAASDTTLTVYDASSIADNNILTLRNSAGAEEDVTVNGTPDKSVPGAHVVTIDKPAGGTVYAYAIGDRMTLSVPFIPDNKIALRAQVDARNSPSQWICTPSLIKSGNVFNPQPGRYTWSYFKTDRPPYFGEVGAGIHGGPVVFAPGAWVTMRISA